MFRITQNASATRPEATPAATREVTPAARPPATPGARKMAVPAADACLEAGFRAWVEGHAKADVIVIGASEPFTVPLEDALHRLSMSVQPLGPADGSSLGMPDDVTIGAAATALLHARTDPDGPRCRSFRSATYFLVGRAMLALDEDAVDVHS
jgi:hypothetical protein